MPGLEGLKVEHDITNLTKEGIDCLDVLTKKIEKNRVENKGWSYKCDRAIRKRVHLKHYEVEEVQQPKSRRKTAPVEMASSRTDRKDPPCNVYDNSW